MRLKLTTVALMGLSNGELVFLNRDEIIAREATILLKAIDHVRIGMQFNFPDWLDVDFPNIPSPFKTGLSEQRRRHALIIRKPTLRARTSC